MSHRNSHLRVTPSLPDRPYKGLMPYSEEDAPFFFGREVEREIITANLLASRLTLLYGACGVGKSSVLRAGVSYHLRQLAHQNLVERGTPEFVVVVFSSWRDDPVIGLRDRVQDAIAQALKAQVPTLEPMPPSLALTQTLEAWAERVDANLLIILDQFEQYFLYHPQEDGEGTFATEFPRAVNSAELRASFLVSIREDSLAKLDRFKGRIPNLFDNYLRIEHLDREAARAAIEEPIKEYNRLRATEIEIEPALVEKVLNQVTTGQVFLGEAGRGVIRADTSSTPTEAPIEAPYLQLVMTRLWDEEIRANAPSQVLRKETLDRLGGAERIVGTHLEKVMNLLVPSQQNAAARIFYHLVTPSGAKIAHIGPDLAKFAGLEQTQLTPVLEKLSSPEIRILRTIAPPPDQPAVSRYEIFHEVLAPAIQDWRTRYVQAQERAEAEKRAAREAAERERETARRRELAQAQALTAEQQRRAEEQAKAASRLRRLAVALAVVILVAVGAAVLAIEQQQTAEARQKESERLRLTSIAQALAAQAPRQQELKEDEQAALLARQAYLFNQRGQGPVLDQVDNALRTVLSTPYFSLILRGHEAGVWSVAFSPDGKKLASGSADGTVRLWDLHQSSDDPIILRGHEAGVRSVAFSPDGKTLTSGSDDGTVRLWSLRQPDDEPAVLRGHADGVWSVALSPDGQTLASGSVDGTVRLWDPQQPKAAPIILDGDEGGVSSVVFSPDGRMLASGSLDGIVRVWDVRQPDTAPTILRGHEAGIWSVAFNPDGQTLASSSADNTVRLWDLRFPDADPIDLGAHEGEVRSVAFSPDGQMLASGSSEQFGKTGSVWLWDLRQRDEQRDEEPIAILRGHEGRITSVAFSPDGQTLASGSLDETVRLWDLLQPSAAPAILRGHEARVRSVAFSPDGQTLASGSSDQLGMTGDVRLWDVNQPNATPAILRGHEGGVLSVAFSPDGQTLASASSDNTVRLWDISDPNADPIILGGHKGGVRSVAFSPDGRTLASGSTDGNVRLWDVNWPSFTPTVLRGHETEVTSVVFSPDGQTLASGSDDNTIRLWDMSRLDADPIVLSGHEGGVRSVAFSLDGRTLGSGSVDRTVRLWDVRQFGTAPTVLRGHEGGVWSVAFSPDDQTLASGSADGTVRVWQMRQLSASPTTLRGHRAEVWSVAFSPDGQTLASGSADQTILIWIARTEILADMVCEKVWRNLTPDEWRRFVGKGIPYVRTCPDLPPAPQVSVDAFFVTKGENLTTTVKPGMTITTTIEEVVRIKVEVSMTGQKPGGDLLFTWCTCSEGDRAVLQRVGNPEMLYVAPSAPGSDCIRVVFEKEGVELGRNEIFVDVQEEL